MDNIASDSVQFMQFDSDGNLFIYKPGAGCSGIAQKIPQGFTQDDLSFTGSSKSTDSWSKFASVSKVDIHKNYSKDYSETCIIAHNMKVTTHFKNHVNILVCAYL